MLELRRRHYADPFGRASHGTLEAVESISPADIQRFFETTYRPNGAILSVAGKLDWPRLSDHIERLFGDWEPLPPSQFEEIPPQRTHCHIEHESEQTHITVAFPWLPYPHSDYYQGRAAIGVLSDGMSSRLFTEVREKRGLCYSVFASCHSLRDRGSVMCYAGTTTDRAQETLDVLVDELRRLTQGVDADEVRRLQSRLKSSLIMQQESSASRAGAMAADWYYLGRVLTLEELGRIVAGLTVERINAYLASHPPRELTVVTLGNTPLVPRLVLEPPSP
jgi:predicted Zn-dependent peptidase